MATKDPESTPSTPDPWAILDRLAKSLEQAKSSVTPDGNPDVLSKLTRALERVSEAQVEGAKIIATETRRAHRPSNEVVPQVSVFNRRGVLLSADDAGPHKPPLKCAMMVPFLIEWESCTREEVELLNLLQPGEYRLSLIDKSRVKVGIRIDYKLDGVTPSRLLLNSQGENGEPGSAFNNDNFRLLPSLADMLRQVLRQHDKETVALATAVMSDEEEEALIGAGQLRISA